MGIRHMVSTYRKRLGHSFILRRKSKFFSDDSHPGQPHQLPNILPSFPRAERVLKNPRMGGDPLVGHQGWPCEAEKVKLVQTFLKKCHCPAVLGRALIRSINKNVSVEGITHFSSSTEKMASLSDKSTSAFIGRESQ